MHDLQEILDPLKNPITYAVPFFVLTILVELAALRWLDNDEPAGQGGPTAVALRGYEARDSRASLLMGAGSLVSTTIFKIGSFFVFTAAFVFLAPWELPTDTWWYWLLLIVTLDLLFYANHRFVHRVNVGWAAHQAHHSSEYMNFTTALRQKWNPWFELIFFLPLPLLGFSPWTIYVAFAFNLIYQFAVHTEVVDKLWAPIELVFNTPSHHRVHHGSDPEYLDSNYAGIFIVWDRLFGTFVAERHRPTYGLTTPVGTYDVVTLQFGHYARLWQDVRGASSNRERLALLFGPPGRTGPRIS
ncbi:sterol desaturase family protein [Nocardioides sp.]|uniref:sterol desaturase family protein n=1 Tax=Nocardioides sp. TaxID=35761 RepID=UPI0026124AD6|nr:sterol desaturase family protein [Nocardioides sp.]